MMSEIWRETFLIHSRTAEYRYRVRLATIITREFLDQHRRSYVAYSGGKDSTVLIHLVTRQASEIAVIHSDEGSAPIILNEIVNVARGAGGVNWRIDRPLNVHAVAAEGFDGVFVGLRKEESGKRKRRMLAGGRFGPIDECWPLADWTWMDVWAYLVSHDVPYHSLYDQVAPVVGYDQARYHHLFDDKIKHTDAATIDGILHWRHRGPSR